MYIEEVKSAYDLTLKYQELIEQIRLVEEAKHERFKIFISQERDSVEVPKEVLLDTLREHKQRVMLELEGLGVLIRNPGVE